MNDRTQPQDSITARDGLRPDLPPGASTQPTAPTDQRITGEPPPPSPAAPPSKRVQWIVAAVLLALMVFAVTFAMNYLGGPRPTGDSNTLRDPNLERQLTFISWKDAPGREDEVGEESHSDYWFINEHDKPVTIGLANKACTCSSVQAFALPTDSRSTQRRQTFEAAWAFSFAPLGPLAACCAANFAMLSATTDRELSGKELLKQGETFEVPAGGLGWLRLSWTGDKAGVKSLGASMWMNDAATGPIAELRQPVMHHEPYRARSAVQVGTLTDEELEKGVTRTILVWSSTRTSFKLVAKPSVVLGGNPKSDPFEVGDPVELTRNELRKLEELNNSTQSTPQDAGTAGSVRSGWKVPLRFRATSKDGSRQFDVGPFQRGVLLSSPDVVGEPKLVFVRGRVVGLVELGASDDEAGATIDFRTFLRRDGAKATPLQLTSSVPGLKLEFDKVKTPKFLDAKLSEPVKVGEARQGWTLSARVKPNEASGPFPRHEDPLYEDSAIYLLAREGNKPPRPIRIAVRGTAN